MPELRRQAWPTESQPCQDGRQAHSWVNMPYASVYSPLWFPDFCWIGFHIPSSTEYPISLLSLLRNFYGGRNIQSLFGTFRIEIQVSYFFSILDTSDICQSPASFR
jgi:hypothetical protein